MTAPDFAGVLAAHRIVSDVFSPYCACGKWRDKRDDGTAHRAHVAAALHAELVAWLGSEDAGVTAGDAICSGHGDGVCFNFDPDVDGPCSRCEADARAALAALAQARDDLSPSEGKSSGLSESVRTSDRGGGDGE